MKISLHQMHTVIGDLQGNYEKIVKLIAEDRDNLVDISVFPETALSGYTCGALWDRPEFVYEQQDLLHQIAARVGSKQCVIIGFVKCEGINRNGFPKLKNSVACINQGNIQVYDKQLLANSDHHEDRKYFRAGTGTKVFEIETYTGKRTIGCPVCEDSWFNSHHRNIPEEMVAMGAEILISINQSYFYYGKQKVRYDLFKSIAKNNNVPVVMVNSCGVGDILKNVVIFDGGSMVFDKRGNLTHISGNFEENSSIHNNTSTIEPKDKSFLELYGTGDSKFDEIFDALVFEQREFFKACGIKNAQVHLSGGLDSSIVAAIVATAMGKENTIFITNPSSLNLSSKTFTNAQQTADELGIHLYVNPVEEIYQTIKRVDDDSFKDSGLPQKPQGLSTMHAVLRSVQAIAANHRFNAGIVSCGNHTENVLGWASFHDIGSIGVHQPLGDMTKLELYKFAEYINLKFGKEIIPTN
jgi:predicted amidohydrolase/NH3-dependent NAD+ synthetase